jgi:hypothetical protein
VGEDGVAAEERDVAGARDVSGFIAVPGHAMGGMLDRCAFALNKD